ncbi:hypothetical protein CEXT_750061 [Caerostris extrusa]|uniref:Uncharacterized protein n=1 Tax=Caerostris extrusa TaxID=172846 RepID=A0AAV4XLU4_CAEEX|nr:hypothetical protein CEXT_750061 [Caerostris extrusa]
MAEMELEGAEGERTFSGPVEVPLQSSNEIFILKKKKTRCQEIITTQANMKCWKLNWPLPTTGMEQLKMLHKDIARCGST